MNKLLLFVVLASVVACTTAQSAQCVEATEQCGQAYLNSLSTATNQDHVCDAANTYLSCVKDDCGDFPADTLRQMQDNLNQRGYQCSISGTAALSVSLLLVPIMAALPAAIRKLW